MARHDFILLINILKASRFVTSVLPTTILKIISQWGAGVKGVEERSNYISNTSTSQTEGIVRPKITWKEQIWATP